MEVVNFTKFDEKHCHKWALLLNERKIGRTSAALDPRDFNKAKKLTHEAFHGGSCFCKYADLGMEGSLLYHTAIVSKMAAESRLVLKELKVKVPDAFMKNGSAANLLMHKVTG